MEGSQRPQKPQQTPPFLGPALSTSGFNVARPVSWEPTLAGFGGLTEADVAAALALEKVCETASEATKHLKIMRGPLRRL